MAVYNAAAPAGGASGAAALLTGYTINETANYGCGTGNQRGLLR